MTAKAKAKSLKKSRPPAPSAKNEQDEYATFETALKKVLTVPRDEMQKRLSDASAARASSDED